MYISAIFSISLGLIPSYLWRNVSSRFSINSEANASELIENQSICYQNQNTLIRERTTPVGVRPEAKNCVGTS